MKSCQPPVGALAYRVRPGLTTSMAGERGQMTPREALLRNGIGMRCIFVLAACMALLVWCGSARGYNFGPAATPVGPQTTVFKWSSDACDPNDIPDTPARAFRDSSGRVQLLASHYATRRFAGPDLNNVRHEWPVLLDSALNPDTAAFRDKNWLAAPYTLDGQTIYALLHEEYEGYTHPGGCDPSYQGFEVQRCWYNAVTFARSTDAGSSYQLAPRASRLVAALPYRYEIGAGSYGYFNPSNIVYRPDDGYYYVLVASHRDYGAQRAGDCLLRTQNLADPGSWRGWDGTSFSVSFVDPYAGTVDTPSDHVCSPVSPDQIGGMTSSLTYNTYYDRYMLVGSGSTENPNTGRTVTGFFYSLSSDLIHWSPRRLLMSTEFPWTYKCGADRPGNNP